MQVIDSFLNSFTMYKIVLYGLILLAFCAFILSILGIVPFSPFLLLSHLGTLVIVCFSVNFSLSKLFRAPMNTESYLITAFILFFIIPSAFRGYEGIWISALAGAIAMASKYVLNIRKRHLFNPAAIGAVFITFLGFSASWWVATPTLVPAALIISLLVIRKLRKFSMFFSFALVVIIEILVFGIIYNAQPQRVLSQLLLSWPFLFFAGFMLTEPLTMPPTRHLQMLYGGLIGFLFSFQLPLGPVILSPELALITGNIFAYIVGSKQRIILSLEKIERLSPTIYNFVFLPSENLKFTAGQYVEWTLPHKNPDIRGNRRYFTVASAPTEKNIMLGARIEDGASSFKRALINLKKNDKLSVGSLAGDFMLPGDKNKKLVFVAGGIGITPFRSMIKSLIDKNEKRDIVLFHTCSRGDDFVYNNVFSQAVKELGLQMHCLLTEKDNAPKKFSGEFGHLDEVMLKKTVPDYKERAFYISGSNVMVEATKKTLKLAGVSRSKIVTDYFSGY